MKKEEFIRRYGEMAYETALQQNRDWRAEHYEVWQKNNPNKVIANREKSYKGGKYYEKHKLAHKEGLTGEKERVRQMHSRLYRPFKKIIAPTSQIHHQWLPRTADFTGVALVEKDQHMHGFIDVIQILEGEITLLTEREIRGE